MKTNYRIPKTEAKKLYVAASSNKVKLGEPVEFGKDELMIDLEYKDGADLIELGRLIDKVSGNEFDAADLKAKQAAEAKAKAAAKK